MVSHQASLLPGGRLHLQEGPIDLVIGCDGPAQAVAAAHQAAQERFDGMLAELAGDLPALRSAEPLPLRGQVARAMAAAVAPFRPDFITPMAAVAGAVADAVAASMQGCGLRRAWVNNGGDIALLLAPGEFFVAEIAGGGTGSRVTIGHESPVRGLATSGWRGRSFSFGIADAVTVLAPSAAIADAAATMIANRVDLPGHAAIRRRPACELQAQCDLGARLVTCQVGPLSMPECRAALAAGADFALGLVGSGMIAAAALSLGGETALVGPLLQPEDGAPIGG